MYKMTKEDQFKENQRRIKVMLENQPLDLEEKEELEYLKTLTIDDFKDETEEEFKKRKLELKEMQEAQGNGNYTLVSVDKNGNEKVVYSKRTKPMTMNVDVVIINKIKAKANDLGISYQPLINMILKQYADGKINITL